MPEAKKTHPGQLVDVLLLLDKKAGQDVAIICCGVPADSKYVSSLLQHKKEKEISKARL